MNIENNTVEFLSVLAYVKISTYRTRTIYAIGNDIITPTTIAKKANIRTNHISKTLAELKEKRIVVCINEEMRKGRLYRLTGLGLAILESLEKDKEKWSSTSNLHY